MKTEIDHTKELLTTDELAAMFKVCKKTIYSLVSRRRIRFHKVGRSHRFDINDVIAYLQENRVEVIK